MQRDEVRRRALSMAAKVALGTATLAGLSLGCGGTVELAEQGDQSDRGEQEASASPAHPGFASKKPVPTVGLSQTSCLKWSYAPPTEAEELCCEGVVEAAFPGDVWQPPPANPSNELSSCCGTVVSFLDQAHSGGGQPSAAHKISYLQAEQCCQLAGNPVGPTCTPWGPPTPPAMRASRRRALLEVVA